eukprot:CAMPEP_0181109768 /NCGR_PEP_ID=MMETSP1071-20121207/18352_1 /TAXON_ID=35127 /ORGANISM="Thalassiosira sp., Strain NH16" /LENGTH=297 /DNA_ID=CAMNT_0023193485 /DNA_START=63 /DNA_END=956 /DNA_ORIENTATION=+
MSKSKTSVLPCIWLRLLVLFALFNVYIIVSFNQLKEEQRAGQYTYITGLGPPPGIRRRMEEKDDSAAHRSKPHEKEERPWPKPDDWDLLSFDEIWHHFDCSNYSRDKVKPLPSIEDWIFLQKMYREYVDENLPFDDPVPPTMGYTLDEERPPPYYAHIGDRGRGLFASRDLKKGELVHDGGPGDIIFPSPLSWRSLVFNLPRNKACDMMDWTWTQQPEEDGDFLIFSAVNICVLLNGGNEKNTNVNPKSSHSSKLYALRDIEKGEELLTDYDMYPTVYEEVGLGRLERRKDPVLSKS